MPSGTTRLHALDGLRAAMMLLGLVLHSATSYMQTPLGAAWPYQDSSTSAIADVVVLVIHLFRMPVFFVMAGFFAALLYFRDGGPGFLTNRTRRVLVPLVCAWVILYPLVRGGFIFANAGGGSAGLAVAGEQLLTAPYRNASLVHLWFLYDLLIFYALACVATPLLLRAAPGVMRAAADACARFASGWVGIATMTALTTITILPMSKAIIETSISFIPAPAVLGAYGVFFVFGWVMQTRQQMLGELGRRPVARLGLAVAATVAYLALAVPFLSVSARAPVYTYTLAALATWLWTYAIIAIFLRYLAEPRPLQRYMADASYWIYLVHLPFTIWIPGVLASLMLPALVKVGITLLVTSVVTVVSYHLFVRSTFVGEALNGRRFPRALAAREPGDSRVPAASA